MESQEITSTQRIRELCEIDALVASALQDAGRAVKVLSNQPGTEADDTIQPAEKQNLDGQKADFEKHVKAYYTGVQAVIAKLRRQAYALEEAGVISAEASSFVNAQQPRAQGIEGQGAAKSGVVREPERITNGGLGQLDVGWLNSRSNKVGIEKEAELVKEARELLERVKADSVEQHESTGG